MLKIAVVEDAQAQQEKLSAFLMRYEAERGETFAVHTFADGMDILDDYRADYDVIFLDIHMRHLDGMETARRIRAVDENVQLVFITALAQYAIEGYRVNALDFILKPVVYEQFTVTMDRILRTCEKYRREKLLMVLDGGQKCKLSTNQICYIEVIGHEMRFHTKTKVYTRYGVPLKEIAEQLRPYHFAQSGQSQLVNLKYVDNVKNDVVTVSGTAIYLSRRRKKEFLETLGSYIGTEI